MPRPGITYEQVSAVADALVAEHQKPTLTAVRDRLGSGSMNTIHRHLAVWQDIKKPPARKLSEPNQRLLAALGTEMSRVAEEAASDAEVALAQAMTEMAVLARTGEELETERDELAQQVQQVTSERDALAGKAAEQTSEIERLKAEIERLRNDLSSERSALARVELRLEAVPLIEQELAQLRTQIAEEKALRAAADRSEAVALALREAADQARTQAGERLASAEAREADLRAQLAQEQAAHEQTRQQALLVAVREAGSQVELKMLREQAEADRAEQADGERPLKPIGKKSST